MTGVGRLDGSSSTPARRAQGGRYLDGGARPRRLGAVLMAPWTRSLTSTPTTRIPCRRGHGRWRSRSRWSPSGVRACFLRAPVPAGGQDTRVPRDSGVAAGGGRPVDPADPAHSALVALLGAKAKHEVVRARHRTLAAMRAQTVEQGRFLGGRPPYGYRLVDAGPHPNRAEAAWGRRLHRLGPGCGDCGPRAVDDCPPLKGRSLAGGNRVGGMWSVTTVKTILSNPRYAGREVWNRRQAVGGASDGCAARL